MKIVLLFLLSCAGFAQDIEWSDKYELQVSDFKSPATEIGGKEAALISSAVGISFDVHMTMAQFMFTRNFNSKVSNTFNPDASSIIAPDAETARKMAAFAQYQFDLGELYARKLREELYVSKSTFTNISFVKAAYDRINAAYAERQSMAVKLTQLGQKEAALADLRKEVRREIDTYPDYCKTCKPKKQKK